MSLLLSQAKCCLLSSILTNIDIFIPVTRKYMKNVTSKFGHNSACCVIWRLMYENVWSTIQHLIEATGGLVAPSRLANHPSKFWTFLRCVVSPSRSLWLSVECQHQYALLVLFHIPLLSEPSPSLSCGFQVSAAKTCNHCS
jgi:hypothetical protein